MMLSHPILTTQSLTLALRKAGDFRVVLRALGGGVRFAGSLDSLQHDTVAALQHVLAEPYHAREVVLMLNGEAVVFAQSFFAQKSTFWQNITRCGTQSLGDFLFSDDYLLMRSPLQFDCGVLTPCVAQSLGLNSDTELTLRASTFSTADGQTLWLGEWFLPAIERFFATR